MATFVTFNGTIYVFHKKATLQLPFIVVLPRNDVLLN